jgi:hypothetical protein
MSENSYSLYFAYFEKTFENAAPLARKFRRQTISLILTQKERRETLELSVVQDFLNFPNVGRRIYPIKVAMAG